MLYVGCDDAAGHQEATQASAVGNKGNLSGQLLVWCMSKKIVTISTII